MTGRSALTAAVLGMAWCGWQASGYAQQPAQDLVQEIRELKARVARQEEKIRELEGRLADREAQPRPETGEVPADLARKIDRHLEEKIPAYPFMEGLDISGWVTTVVQATRDANGADKLFPAEDVTDASYSANILLEKKFEDFGWGLVHFQAGNGAGLTDDLALYSNVNYDALDADNDVSITEAWYEHYFKAVPLTVTFGKLDAYSYIDGNEYAWDETSQFISDLFCNSPVIEWPSDNGEAGVRVAWEPAKSAAMDFFASDSDGDGEDAYDALFLAAQLTLKPGLFGKNGAYRFYLWQNRGAHTRWNDAGRDKENGYGAGLSFDQALTDIAGLFLRYGWQDPDVYRNDEGISYDEMISLEQAYTAGVQLRGILRKRPDDVVGMGFGQVFASEKYKQAKGRIAKPETHLECYYNFKANRYFTFSPDLQIIWRPYGKDAPNGDGTIVVSGIRGELDF